MFRIGCGFDVHRFADADAVDAAITLGGISIPFQRKLIAHSDGDVLSHALCDALLGALALGDIGRHFPDSDARYKNISSMVLLKRVYALVCEQGWRLENADITVIAEAPKIAPHQSAICQCLAAALAVPADRISIKATTTEGLGFTGRGEGIAVQSVVLLRKHDDA